MTGLRIRSIERNFSKERERVGQSGPLQPLGLTALKTVIIGAATSQGGDLFFLFLFFPFAEMSVSICERTRFQYPARACHPDVSTPRQARRHEDDVIPMACSRHS